MSVSTVSTMTPPLVIVNIFGLFLIFNENALSALPAGFDLCAFGPTAPGP